MSPRRSSKIAPDRTQSEFSLIDTFLKPFGLAREGAKLTTDSGVMLGPGDDCAQLKPARGMTLCATTDAALDGIHFDLKRSTPEDAGWKALAMNLSDLAAAGARPRWFLCALGVPKIATQNPSAIAAGFARGMAKLAKESGCALVGGNVTRALQWSITIAALGEAKKPLSRAGGKPGDQLFVIGELGAAALGLKLLQTVVNPQSSRKPMLGAGERAAIRAQQRPEPQIEAGLIAARFASAAIDISDGLLQDLGHLCHRSGCGAEIDCDQLPRSKAVKAADKNYELSLAGGEDYALLLAVPPKRARLFLRALPQARLIGHLTNQESKIDLFDEDRASPHPEQPGYDHFK